MPHPVVEPGRFAVKVPHAHRRIALDVLIAATAFAAMSAVFLHLAARALAWC